MCCLRLMSVRTLFGADGLLSEEKQRVAAGLVSSAAAAQDSLMQLSSFLSFESEGGLQGGRQLITDPSEGKHSRSCLHQNGISASRGAQSHAAPVDDLSAESDDAWPDLRSSCAGFLSSTWNSGMAGSDRLPVTIFVQPPSAVMAGGGGQRAGNNTLV